MLEFKRRVIDEDEDPQVVAGEYGISMRELFISLACYYEYRDEFVAQEHEYAAARLDWERRIQTPLANDAKPTEWGE